MGTGMFPPLFRLSRNEIVQVIARQIFRPLWCSRHVCSDDLGEKCGTSFERCCWKRFQHRLHRPPQHSSWNWIRPCCLGEPGRCLGYSFIQQYLLLPHSRWFSYANKSQVRSTSSTMAFMRTPCTTTACPFLIDFECWSWSHSWIKIQILLKLQRSQELRTFGRAFGRSHSSRECLFISDESEISFNLSIISDFFREMNFRQLYLKSFPLTLVNTSIVNCVKDKSYHQNR